MKTVVFVPLSDDLLYNHPERILGPVIPFNYRARAEVQFGRRDDQRAGDSDQEDLLLPGAVDLRITNV